jgi:hypothetical protein
MRAGRMFECHGESHIAITPIVGDGDLRRVHAERKALPVRSDRETARLRTARSSQAHPGLARAAPFQRVSTIITF